MHVPERVEAKSRRMIQPKVSSLLSEFHAAFN